MIRFVFHGDDFGLNHSFNAGIVQAHKNGLLRSTSYRVDGTAFHEAVELARDLPNLGQGVHLNLVEGKEEGRYRTNFGNLLLNAGKKSVQHAIESEFRFQIDTVLAAGVRVDHLNSHQHSHIIPEIFEVVCRLAKEYGISYVRLPNEPYHLAPKLLWSYLKGVPWLTLNHAKWAAAKKFSETNLITARKYGIRTNDVFLGLLHTGHMDIESTMIGIQHALAKVGTDDGVIEILMHPCLPAEKNQYLEKYLESYTHSRERQVEYNALCDHRLADMIKKLGAVNLNYASL